MLKDIRIWTIVDFTCGLSYVRSTLSMYLSKCRVDPASSLQPSQHPYLPCTHRNTANTVRSFNSSQEHFVNTNIKLLSYIF